MKRQRKLALISAAGMILALFGAIGSVAAENCRNNVRGLVSQSLFPGETFEEAKLRLSKVSRALKEGRAQEWLQAVSQESLSRHIKDRELFLLGARLLRAHGKLMDDLMLAARDHNIARPSPIKTDLAPSAKDHNIRKDHNISKPRAVKFAEAAEAFALDQMSREEFDAHRAVTLETVQELEAMVEASENDPQNLGFNRLKDIAAILRQIADWSEPRDRWNHFATDAQFQRFLKLVDRFNQLAAIGETGTRCTKADGSSCNPVQTDFRCDQPGDEQTFSGLPIFRPRPESKCQDWQNAIDRASLQNRELVRAEITRWLSDLAP